MATEHFSAIGNNGQNRRGRPRKVVRDFYRGGILTRLKMVDESPKNFDFRIAHFILSDPQAIIHASVSEVATANDVSDASVVRFCQRLGYKGFQDLKVAISKDLIEPIKLIHEDVTSEDRADTVARKVGQSNIQAITDTLSILDSKALERAVNLIVETEQLYFLGIGFSALVAMDASYRMLSNGKKAFALTDSHMMAVAATLMDSKSVVIAISHSGGSKEVVDALRLAKSAGVHTICLTSFTKSPLTKYADIVLLTSAPEMMFRSEAMASRIAELCIVDALYVSVSLATSEKALDSLDKAAKALAEKRF